MLAVSPALAQEAPALRPPVAQGNTDVPYPPGATGDAAVLLELVVGADGVVSSVVVVEGAEPFAESARSAAAAWRFAPAQRGGTPVAARIRTRVEFHQDQPADAADAARTTPAPVGPAPPTSALAAPTRTPTPTPTPTPTSPLRVPEAATEPPLEVTVRGQRRDIGQARLSDAEVREMPGAFGDPFRAVEALPGVTPLVSGLPYFFMRGAPPNNNGYFLDGIRVPLLFHVGLAQGVIHPGLVDHVDFLSGSAPASYGGVAGAIIAGQTRDPAPAAHGEANLRIVDAGGLVESPVAGGRGSVLLAARYGYPGPVLGAITSDLTLSYWDYQARGTWRLSDRDTLGILAFGSHDYLATPSPSGDPTARPIEQFVTDFHRVDLRYDHALDDGRIRIGITGGHDRQGAAPIYITERSLAVRLDVDRRLSSSVRVRGGAVGRLDDHGFRQNATGPGDSVPDSSANPPPTNLTAGVHADVIWRVSPRVEIVPGLRFDVFGSSRPDAPGSTARVRTTVPAFDPRLSARVMMTPAVAWLSALGVTHQYPALRVGDFAPVFSVPGFPFGDRQLQTAVQASQGVEVMLPADIALTTTGFLSRWSGLTDLTGSCLQAMPDGMAQCPSNQPVRGQAYGLELLARRPLSKRLSGWLSYTLSRSTREAHFITPSGGDAVARVPSEGDRTHVLNAILAYDLGRRWRVGARFVYYTGSPYSRLDGTVPVPPYNALRAPAFFRLDVRIEKRWSLGKHGSIALVIEGQNVTLSTEKSGLFLDCTEAPDAPTRCTQGKVGPLTIPSVGVEVFF
ncbi:MAG TPA: TonB-dependent receptor [Polyangia bacterium]|nr:TonB-dependent receptor [Polyangia bacterium]